MALYHRRSHYGYPPKSEKILGTHLKYAYKQRKQPDGGCFLKVVYNILISYVIVAIVIYIGNIIRQKILTHKLNKEIENKN